jgi:hypothetical protein
MLQINLTMKDWLLDGLMADVHSPSLEDNVTVSPTPSPTLLLAVHRFARVLYHHGCRDMATLSCFAYGLRSVDFFLV